MRVIYSNGALSSGFAKATLLEPHSLPLRSPCVPPPFRLSRRPSQPPASLYPSPPFVHAFLPNPTSSRDSTF